MPKVNSPWQPLRGLRALFITALCSSAVVSATVLPSDIAEARAGGGRSVGRRSSSPSYRQPTYSQPATPRAEPSRPSSAYVPPINNQPPPPPPASRGGFLRSAAGGLAGGFLGSMLFNGLSRGNTSYGGGVGGASGGYGGGGGIGLFEILIFAGLAYFGYRWWRKRQEESTPSFAAPANDYSSDNVVNFRMPQETSAPALASTRLVAAVSAEDASDIFFRIQGAWTRRDLSSVRDLLGSEIAADLGRDLQDLQAQHRINRLENISIRHVDVGEAWSEGGFDQVGVRFTANLLDYTVDETTNKVVAGSDTEPVKFNEDWTFARPSGGVGRWQLVAIDQVQ